MKTSRNNKKKISKNRFGLTILFVLFEFIFLQAQVKNYGPIYIKDGSYFYVKTGVLTLETGSSINTSRTESTYGKLIFGPTATLSGVTSNANLFIDGYSSTKSSSYFELSTGQSTTYAPIGITNVAVTNGVDAAYYAVSPTTIGEILAPTILAIPTLGYWVVKGDNPTITLIWCNNISELTTSIANLTIAGYKISTNKWEAISSGTPTGSLSSGTITTSASVTIENYSAFTIANRGVSCASVISATGTTKTWNGSWLPNAPSEIDPAIISGSGSPGSFICNSLAVDANIILSDGQTIEVVNEISGLGNITMSSQASIIQRNDSSTIFPSISLTKSTRTEMCALDYIYWGSPLAANSFDQLAAAQAYNNTNNNVSGVPGAFDSVYKYISGDLLSVVGWQPLITTTPGVGFIMRIKQQTPFSIVQSPNNTDHINLIFSGVTNNGQVIVPVANIPAIPSSELNFNLLANPYPSAIDADKFLEYNTNLDGVVYIWKAQTSNSGEAGATYSASDYIAFTRAGNTSEPGIGATIFNGKIATGQGFLVKSLTPNGTGTVFFNNCMRVSGSNDQFMRSTNDSGIDRYKLNLNGTNGVGNQILIAYMSTTTLGYDRMYDAELNSASAAQLYSVLDNDTKQLAINARPTFENSDIVNIGVNKSNTTSENFTISISDKEGVFATDTLEIYLHDIELNVFHNLANGPYIFNSNTTELINRFQIVYQNGLLNNIDFEYKNVFTTINNQILKIVASLPITHVAIYDFSGRLVLGITIANETKVMSPISFAEGMYIVKVQLNNGLMVTQKIVNYNSK